PAPSPAADRQAARHARRRSDGAAAVREEQAPRTYRRRPGCAICSRVRLRTSRLLLLGAGLLLGSAAGEFVLRWRCSGEALTRVLADAELHAPDPLRSYRLLPGATQEENRINPLRLPRARAA